MALHILLKQKWYTQEVITKLQLAKILIPLENNEIVTEESQEVKAEKEEETHVEEERSQDEFETQCIDFI